MSSGRLAARHSSARPCGPSVLFDQRVHLAKFRLPAEVQLKLWLREHASLSLLVESRAMPLQSRLAGQQLVQLQLVESSPSSKEQPLARHVRQLLSVVQKAVPSQLWLAQFLQLGLLRLLPTVPGGPMERRSAPWQVLVRQWTHWASSLEGTPMPELRWDRWAQTCRDLQWETQCWKVVLQPAILVSATTPTRVLEPRKMSWGPLLLLHSRPPPETPLFQGHLHHAHGPAKMPTQNDLRCRSVWPAL